MMLGVVGIMGCERALQLQLNSPYCPTPLVAVPLVFASCCQFHGSSFGHHSSSSDQPFFHIYNNNGNTKKKLVNNGFGRVQSPLFSRYRLSVGPWGEVPEPRQSETLLHVVEPNDEGNDKRQEGQGGGFKFRDDNQQKGASSAIREAFSGGNSAIISACVVGLLTGISVVLFNITVHELRDFFWDGIPYRGASWLREEPIEAVWQRVIAVPVCGGLIVGMLNAARGSLEGSTQATSRPSAKSALEPVLKTAAASVTLGTGNSLGPEGPSVEIGVSIAQGIGTMQDSPNQRNLSLIAAGSAAGISSGFNAAVAGCFFAVESVLWPSTAESSSSLANTTSMVILSAVIASVVSEIGLGFEPAFAVPEYDFRSPSELPLYLLLGVLCGLVSLTLSRCTSFMLVSAENVHKTIGISKYVFPVLGGLAVGLMALGYPEILYWGFQNVDILLESRPLVRSLSADLLLQLVAVKIVATSLCRASGFVGGYYAPSLFIGAATGMAYGKIVSSAVSQTGPFFHLSFLDVASPQAYGLVGMAATLAGVCQVPLTAVLLLFELTQDYRIVLPLLGAVGMSSWITSGNTMRTNAGGFKKLESGEKSIKLDELSSADPPAAEGSDANNLCAFESSLCIDGYNYDIQGLGKNILVSQAMRTRYVAVLLDTSLAEVVNLMLVEKQSCAVIVDDNNILIGFFTLGNIEEFSRSPKAKGKRPEDILVSELCPLNGESCRIPCTVTPCMDILSAQTIMMRNGIDQLPVIVEHVEGQHGQPVGILDKECISLARRVIATGEFLSLFSTVETSTH